MLEKVTNSAHFHGGSRVQTEWPVPAWTHARLCVDCPLTARRFGKVATAEGGTEGRFRAKPHLSLWNRCVTLAPVRRTGEFPKSKCQSHDFLYGMDHSPGSSYLFVSPYLFGESDLLLYICSQEIRPQRAPIQVQVTGSKDAAVSATG